MKQLGPLSRNDLAAPFSPPLGAAEQVGIEVESAVLDARTGRAVPYGGPGGIGALLKRLLEDNGGEPVLDHGHLSGLRRADGSQFSLEPGGALEYSSPPCGTLTGVVAKTQDAFEQAADAGRRFGLALLPGGNYPFTSIDEIPWVPKARLPIMRNYFARLGEQGSLADGVMGLALATQATLDYLSEEDLTRKLRMQVVASPVAVALFANSPLEGGRVTGMLSRRTWLWRKMDPCRCGILPFAIGGTAGVDNIIDWLLRIPMVYRYHGGRYEAPPARPFGSMLRDGLDDGSAVTAEDWRSHLSQVWPHVRVRSTLELRAADGLTYPDMPAVPAFWTGLTYHAPAREAAWELLRGRPLAEYQQAVDDAAIHGLAARLGTDPVRPLAGELVRLARKGLEARVAAGQEEPRALRYLDPLEEVAASGVTFAERCLQHWDGHLRRQPDRYVEAYRV